MNECSLGSESSQQRGLLDGLGLLTFSMTFQSYSIIFPDRIISRSRSS